MADETPLISIGAMLPEAANRLAKVSDTPDLDAQVLLAKVLGKPRAWVVAHPEHEPGLESLVEWQASLHRVEGGEPLPYVLGRWEFFGLEFEVTPDVLIPRPETELLVERAIAWLQQNNRPGRKMRVLDVGTGSGCIAIALAANMPGIEVMASDISPEALAVARGNARRLVPDTSITFAEADIFPGFTRAGKFDLVAANLPYIPTRTVANLPVARHEPRLALEGGMDGLDLIRRLLAIAPRYLQEQALMLLEIEISQGGEVTRLAGEHFPGAQIILHPDLCGLDRLLEIRLNSGEENQ